MVIKAELLEKGPKVRYVVTNQSAPPQFSIQVEQGVPHLTNLLIVLVALSAVPLLFA